MLNIRTLDDWSKYDVAEKVAAMDNDNAIDMRFTLRGLEFHLRTYHPYGQDDWFATALYVTGIDRVSIEDEDTLTRVFGHQWPNEFLWEWYDAPQDAEGLFEFVDELVTLGRGDLYLIAEREAAPLIERWERIRPEVLTK